MNRDLDLVLVAANAKPPVCKVMDYNKFKYEQKKKERENKQKTTVVKEMRLGPRIGENDFQIKLKKCREFLSNGDRLKVSMRFRGREMAFTKDGFGIVKRLGEELSDIATITKHPKLDGRNIFMSLDPIK